MFRLFSAFAAALLSTPATSLAACCGMNFRRFDASSTDRPRIAWTTRRALRVEPRTYLAVAVAFIAVLLRARGAVGALAVTAIRAGRGELAEPVADHVLGDVHGHVIAAVVDGHRVPDERREDHGRARPGLDDLLLALLVHQLDAAEQPGLDERALLDGSGHLSPPLLLAMPRADDESTRSSAPGSIAHRGLAPWRLRGHARRGLALAAAVRMVPRVHDDAADLGPLAHVPRAAGLAEVLVLVIEIADLSDRGHAADADPAHLTRGQAHLGVLALLGQQLRGRPGGAHDLAALARNELDVVDRRAERDVRDRQRIADARLGGRPGNDHVADSQPVRQEHVPLLAVAVVQQPDPRRAVRVVFDRRDPCRHVVLVALEVDAPVVGLLAAATVAHREPTLVVPARPALHRLEQGLVRLGRRDLVEGRPGHAAATRRGWLVGTQRHLRRPR